jgi:hypothetical protein
MRYLRGGAALLAWEKFEGKNAEGAEIGSLAPSKG